MNELSRSAVSRHKIKPAAFGNAFGKPQDAIGNGIAMKNIAEEPSVSPAGAQILLDRLNIRHDRKKPRSIAGNRSARGGLGWNGSGQIEDGIERRTSHFHLFEPAVPTTNDSNSRFRDVQTLGQQAAKLVIGAPIDRRSQKAHAQGATGHPFHRTAPRAR